MRRGRSSVLRLLLVAAVLGPGTLLLSGRFAIAADVEADAEEEPPPSGREGKPEQLLNLQQREDMEFLNVQWRRAMAMPPGTPERVELLMRLHQRLPDHLGVAVNLGLEKSETPQGVQLLEDCFDRSVVKQTLPDHDVEMAWRLANFLGRYRHHEQNYEKAQKFFEIALDLSKVRFPNVGDACSALQLATSLDTYPVSVERADRSLEKMNEHAANFFLRKNRTIDDQLTSDLLPQAAKDPYEHCLLTLFYLSFYYRADVAAVASQHYNLTVAAWPEFVQVTPHVEAYDAKVKAGEDPKGTCVDRKLRLGVVSGALSESHPVTQDFSGVLTRLDRNKFDVTYVYLGESGDPPASFVIEHGENRLIHISKDARIDFRNSTWIRRHTPQLAELELDLILYLDLTMSPTARRMGIQRLAPVQLNTHGHPITSGHPRSTVQYYVSWAEAELAPDEAQAHYTEELVLIPNGTIHQYYTPRVLDGNKSRLDGIPFKDLSRKDFNLPEDVRLYLNMQKPFKLHPEYDELVCGILKNDPEGHLILHHSDEGHEVFQARLLLAGCDLDRVHFVPMQPHHRLLALYEISTLVLDSYPAGGCTTTREVLELGKVVVTLPARLLGGRWSLGLYNIIGLDEEAKKAVIASTPEEFIELAVNLGTNDTLRKAVEESIAKAAPNLFGREESVKAWEKILLKASPYEICPDFEPESSTVKEEETVAAEETDKAVEEVVEEEEL